MWKQTRRGWPRFLESLSVLFLIAGLFAGIGIIGWQALMWLQSAVWRPVSVLMAFQWLGFDPTSWLTLRTALHFIPLSITLVILAILVANMVWAYADYLRNAPKRFL
jgi:hypothetical protein